MWLILGKNMPKNDCMMMLKFVGMMILGMKLGLKISYLSFMGIGVK